MSTTPFFGGFSGSITIVIKGIARVGATIVGFTISPLLGTILAIGGTILTIRNILSVSLSIRRSRKVSNTKDKKQEP